MKSKKTYDIKQSFTENITYGPFFQSNYPQLRKPRKVYSLFGQTIYSRFGLAASPMTFGAKNTSLYSKLGYDIITYRSVRSVQWQGVEYPNWRYVNSKKKFNPADLGKTLLGSEQPFAAQEVSTANSFGIQSLAPQNWQQDYENAKKLLQPGQVLILAMMITPETGKSVIADARAVARYAAKTSADIFEINLSCPNSGSSSLVYEDVKTSVAICRAIKKIIGKRHLLAKVGYFMDQAKITEFLDKTRGIIAGITSTNTYSMQVKAASGKNVFPGRPMAGISGGAIRQLSMQQAETIVQAKKDLQLPELIVIGIGGVLKPKHIDEYLALGVDAVQAATGIWQDPYLAAKYKGLKW